jgi:hypothetical protein
MPELQSNGIYESYLAELFNPLAGGTQFNPQVNPLAGAMGGISGAGFGAQTPWSTPQQAFAQQAFPQQTYPQHGYPQLGALWPQQGAQAPMQALPAIAQHIAAKQAVQAIQLSQVLNALQQIVHMIAVQQQLVQNLAHVSQPHLGYGGVFGAQQQPFRYGFAG